MGSCRNSRGRSCACWAPRRHTWHGKPRRALRDEGEIVIHVSEVEGGSSLELGKVRREAATRSWAFAAWKQPRSNARRVALQGLEFYAFTLPHENTFQVAVWRQLGDVVASGYRLPVDSSPLLVKVVEGESFSPGRMGARIGPLADLYQRKPFDRRAWVYWESFWVPGVNLDRKSFQPWLSKLTLEHKEAPGPNPEEAAATEDGARHSKADAFAEIYRRGVWPGLCSRSGPGSDPFHPMVRIAITALDMAVDLLEATSMLDAACGDAAWIAAGFLSRRPGVRYIGIDIVSHVIEENRQKFPNLRFLAADLSHCELPEAELIFSKETLNHMFVEDAVHALRVLQSSGARYLVTNIHRGAPNNRGAAKGHHAHYAPYDYSLPPFNLRKLCPLVCINVEDWTEYALFALEQKVRGCMAPVCKSSGKFAWGEKRSGHEG
ncbi:unnamed protein product [Effrenium voratum]|nr:unnamed protein product [Effrenium voratum]